MRALAMEQLLKLTFKEVERHLLRKGVNWSADLINLEMKMKILTNRDESNNEKAASVVRELCNQEVK